MEAFLDESGTHSGSPIVGVAGWVGAHWQWSKFLSHWGEKPFHAKDPRCEPLKHGLAEAIEFAELDGFVAWMQPEDYEPNSDPVFRSAIGNAYAVCAFDCVLGICKFVPRHTTAKTAFVIEDGQSNSKFIREVLDGMKAKRSDLGIASVGLAGKKDFVQLITADFLAYSRTSDPKWFEVLMSTGHVAEDHITGDRMRRMSDELLRRYRILKYRKQLLKRQRKQQSS